MREATASWSVELLFGLFPAGILRTSGWLVAYGFCRIRGIVGAENVV